MLGGVVGIGKSALLRLAETEARQRGMSVLSVTAVPTEAQLPSPGLTSC
jgi:predicted ATP-dependent serine protease